VLVPFNGKLLSAAASGFYATGAFPLIPKLIPPPFFSNTSAVLTTVSLHLKQFNIAKV
jgi:hypothetical protein